VKGGLGAIRHPSQRRHLLDDLGPFRYSSRQFYYCCHKDSSGFEHHFQLLLVAMVLNKPPKWKLLYLVFAHG
jgi:hypothetical protein